MHQFWLRFIKWIDDKVPVDSPRRKVLQLTSIILLVEGISVVALFSYVGLFLGLASVAVGATLMTILARPSPMGADAVHSSSGVRLVRLIESTIGGEISMMAVGALVIILVVLYNIFVSERPGYGDVDTISLLFGGLLIAYPLASRRWIVETTFSLVFVGFVVLFLVVPQAVMSIGGGGETSSVGNWYVHYMLAAPFAGILDIIGIPAYSTGNLVTLAFHDGSVHTLAISAYCAGLYSFSIFLSAFLSFVLVFERLPVKTLVLILSLGTLVAYLGNLLRMVVVGVVGYYYGLDALHWTHENVGWVIFMTWSALFWWIILARVSRGRTHTTRESEGD